MAFTIEQLQPSLNIIEAMWSYKRIEPDVKVAVDFLTGNLTTIPGFAEPGYINYAFAEFITLVKDATITEENRLLLYRFFRHPMVEQDVRYEIVRKLFNEFPKDIDDMVSMMNENIPVLQALGWTDENIAGFLQQSYRGFISVEELRKDDNEYIRFINKAIKNLSPEHLYAIEKGRWDDTTAMLLYVHHKEAWKNYVQNNELSEYDAVINASVIRFVLKYEQKAYNEYYHKLIGSSPEISFSGLSQKFKGWLYYSEFNDINNEMEKLSERYLKELMLNNPETYESSYAGLKYRHLFSYEHEDMPLSGWAFYILSLTDVEKAMKYVLQFHQRGDAFRNSVLEMLWKQAGEKFVPLLNEQLYRKNDSKWYEEKRAGFFVRYFKERKDTDDLDLCWQFSRFKSKKTKDTILQFLIEEDVAAEQKALNFINDKNAEMRIAAARILAQLSTPAALTALKQSIRTEKDDEARNLMLDVAGDEYLSAITFESLPVIIEEAAKRGKLKKAFAPWLKIEELPAVYFNDGTVASQDFVRFLFYRMSLTKTMSSDLEVRTILSTINRTQTSHFAQKIIKLFFDNKAEAKYKYILALGALVGDEEIVEKLRSSIEKFIDEGRVKMAESAVGALVLQGSNKALRWVEFFSRKYRSKKANVGAAALVALENAATELGITTHELGDRVVPDFGFDGLYKTFVADAEEYRAFIDSNFKIAFFNEDNKKIKTVPAASDAVLKDEFKAIAKEVRDIVKSQSPRLEYYLIIQRKWSYSQWQQFFLQNPVMFIYATKLLWGVFDDKEQLQQAFLCLEDTSLINIQHDEISIQDDAFIGIVHPTQLSAAELQQWQQLCFDLKVDPVFPQLDRRKADISEMDLTRKIIRTYEGKHMQTGSIRSTLERYGWHKSSNTDGGYIASMHLLYFEKKLEAVLELEGVSVGYGWGGDEKLGRVYVIDTTKMTNKWDTYPKSEDDEKLVPFNQLPPIFMSEMLAAIEAIKPVEAKI